jgi:hypothetical protein
VARMGPVRALLVRACVRQGLAGGGGAGSVPRFSEMKIVCGMAGSRGLGAGSVVGCLAAIVMRLPPRRRRGQPVRRAGRSARR